MSRAIEAGRAFVTLGIKNNLDKGLKRAQSSLNKFGTKTQNIGKALAGMGTALGAPFVFAAAKFMAFDDAIRMTGAVAGAQGDAFESLKDKALELGRTTSFTATEVANLMTELARAGFNPDQINSMTGAVLNLSKATGTEATLAAGIMAATMRQFGLEAEEAGRAADVLTAGANKSFNSVESLGEALKYAGPVAADMGMSVEETVAILGTLGNVGIQGSSAGNALKRLATLSAAEAEKMKRIFGVEFLDAAGNARPLVDVLGEVATATEDLPTGERAKKFNKAFGLLGITGASAISKNVANTKELLKQIKAAGGIAETTATQMEAGLGGSFRKLLSAAEGLVIAIGEGVAPVFKGLADAATAAFAPLTAWAEKNAELLKWIVGIAAGLVTMGGALIGLGLMFKLVAVAVGGLAGVFSILATGIAFLASPVAIAIAAMAGLGYAIYKYSDQGVKAIEWLKETFGPFVETVRNAVSAITALMGEGDFAGAWAATAELMEYVWLSATTTIRNVWTDLVAYMLNLGGMLAMGVGTVFEFIGTGIVNTLESIRDVIVNAIDWSIKLGAKIRGVDVGNMNIGEMLVGDGGFGGIDSMKRAAQDVAKTMADFGSNMSDAAEAGIEQRNKDADAAKMARDKRLADLKASIDANSAKVNADIVAADAAKEKSVADEEVAELQTDAAASLEAAAATGPTATFDAFSASILGMGPRFESESLKAQKETAKNTADIAKNLTQANPAEFVA